MARKITEKFKNPSVEGISFCNIALKAHENGRDELAIKVRLRRFFKFAINKHYKILLDTRIRTESIVASSAFIRIG